MLAPVDHLEAVLHENVFASFVRSEPTSVKDVFRSTSSPHRPFVGCGEGWFQIICPNQMVARERQETPLQQELPLRVRGRGGRRENAGRKRMAASGVPHRARPVHKARHPVHVTLRTVWKV